MTESISPIRKQLLDIKSQYPDCMLLFRAIFFLGMSAAFGGKLVEKDIHRSSLLACICFTVGMVGTGLTIQFLKGAPAVILIYLFYGCIMGIGLGIGYLTPVKTLMLWFSEQKGLATGISIMGFGLAKAIATPIMEYLQNNFGISMMFLPFTAEPDVAVPLIRYWSVYPSTLKQFLRSS